MENELSYENHPFAPCYHQSAVSLFVGSFPPVKLTRKVYGNDQLAQCYREYLYKYPFNPGKDISFYYGSSENYFWPLLRSIYQISLNSPEEIVEFLFSRQLGMTDLFERCRRKTVHGRIHSADSSLIVLEKRDFLRIFNECRNLKRIYFTGKWVYSRFVKDYPGTHYELIQLESPSGSYDRQIGTIEEYRQNKKVQAGYNTFSYRLEKYRGQLQEV